jgi:hypothetical protein
MVTTHAINGDVNGHDINQAVTLLATQEALATQGTGSSTVQYDARKLSSHTKTAPSSRGRFTPVCFFTATKK